MTLPTVSDTPCRICNTSSPVFYQDTRPFYKCPDCFLIFTNQLPEKSFEEAHYKSQWKETDPGFWKEQAEAVASYIKNYGDPKRVLDFGAGSGELSKELENMGYQMTTLEPMVDGYLKEQNYPFKFDVVIAIEVIEHLPDVWGELEQIEKVLAPGGIIIISTSLTNRFISAPNVDEIFKDWWYKDDPTHLSFFCNRTLSVMADKRNYDIDIHGDKVFIIRLAG